MTGYTLKIHAHEMGAMYIEANSLKEARELAQEALDNGDGYRELDSWIEIGDVLEQEAITK